MGKGRGAVEWTIEAHRGWAAMGEGDSDEMRERHLIGLINSLIVEAAGEAFIAGKKSAAAPDLEAEGKQADGRTPEESAADPARIRHERDHYRKNYFAALDTSTHWHQQHDELLNEIRKVSAERDAAIARAERAESSIKHAYETLKECDVYGTGGDITACAREAKQRMSELAQQRNEWRQSAEERKRELDHVSGALCDSGVTVYDEAGGYGLSIRELTARAEAAEAKCAEIAEEVDGYKEIEAEQIARYRELAKATDVQLREVLGPCFSHLWGPNLEQLGGFIDDLKARLAATEKERDDLQIQHATMSGALCNQAELQDRLAAAEKERDEHRSAGTQARVVLRALRAGDFASIAAALDHINDALDLEPKRTPPQSPPVWETKLPGPAEYHEKAMRENHDPAVSERAGAVDTNDGRLNVASIELRDALNNLPPHQPKGDLWHASACVLRALMAVLTTRDEMKEPERAGTDPIPMVLHCPECRTRHIDEGEFATKAHHTHSCQECGLTWRPSVVPTIGVQFLPGFKNEPATPLPADEGKPPGPPDLPGSRCEFCGGHPSLSQSIFCCQKCREKYSAPPPTDEFGPCEHVTMEEAYQADGGVRVRCHHCGIDCYCHETSSRNCPVHAEPEQASQEKTHAQKETHPETKAETVDSGGDRGAAEERGEDRAGAGQEVPANRPTTGQGLTEQASVGEWDLKRACLEFLDLQLERDPMFNVTRPLNGNDALRRVEEFALALWASAHAAGAVEAYGRVQARLRTAWELKESRGAPSEVGVRVAMDLVADLAAKETKP